jgi:predicted enzyme related to lactoylglutathione lyase
MENNIVGWFEIPVDDMERAIAFYEKVLNVKLSRNKLGVLDMAWFPWVEGGYGSGGSLVHHPDHYKTSQEGVLIYLTSPTGDLKNELSRVNEAGGNVIRGKSIISEEHGFMGLFTDTEGNRIAIHSRK